ncbi:MAG: rod-binding protein [Alphaproteobacteria bacterium]
MKDALAPDTTIALLQASQTNAPQTKSAMNQKRVEESAREFEAVFLTEMMKPMFEGLETNDMFGGGKGEEIFRGVLLQEYGKEIAKKDIIGVQTQVQNKLIELQAERTTQAASPAIQSGHIIDVDPLEG